MMQVMLTSSDVHFMHVQLAQTGATIHRADTQILLNVIT